MAKNHEFAISYKHVIKTEDLPSAACCLERSIISCIKTMPASASSGDAA